MFETRRFLPTSALKAVFFSVLALLFCASLRAAPPERSTLYDGASSVTYTHSAFELDGPATLEAWVWREDASRCETILGQSQTDSAWFGFCPNLRLFTEDGSSVDATSSVPERRWCHVAATVDAQGQVTLFIDGEVVGVGSALPPDTRTGQSTAIGSDNNGKDPFLGAIDELRIWSQVRTPAQIADGRFEEIRDREGLRVAIADGGDDEVVAGANGIVSGSPVTQTEGVLPSTLSVPRARVVPTLDGHVAASEYEGGDELVVVHHSGSAPRDPVARFIYDDQYLWVGVEPAWPGDGAEFSRDLILFFDPDPQQSADELAVLVRENGDVFQMRSVADGGFVFCQDVEGCPSFDLFLGTNGADRWSVEFRVARELLGEGDFALAVGAPIIGDPKKPLAITPGDAQLDDPSTWARAEFSQGPAVGPGTCADPVVLDTGVHEFDLDQASEQITQSCLPSPTSSEDAIFEFTAPNASRYRVVARPLKDENLSLIVATRCSEQSTDCLGASDDNGSGDPEVVEVDLAASQTVTVVVSQSRGAGTPGRVEVRIQEIDPEFQETSRVVRIHARNNEGYAVALQSFSNVWSASEDQLMIIGEMAREEITPVAAERIGVSVFEPPEVPRVREAKAALRFGKFRYAPTDDQLELCLIDPGDDGRVDRSAWIVSELGDVEPVVLKAQGDGTWKGILSVRPEGLVRPLPSDGELVVSAGDVLVAISDPSEGEGSTYALAMIAGRQPTGRVQVVVDPAVKPPVGEIDGRIPGEAPRALGAFLDEATGAEILIGSEELIVDSQDGQGILDELRTRAGARVIDDGTRQGVEGYP
ncbi:MAG: LamG-like jellyroll fold domain-containing protein, partial [Planctomycetota bacterium]